MGEAMDFLTKHDPNFTPARLPSLYADFNRMKGSNPEGYSANVRSWQNALSKLVKAGVLPGNKERLVLGTGDGLREALTTKDYGYPSGLPSVISEARARNIMIPLDIYLGSTKSIYESGWPFESQTFIQWGLLHLGLASKLAPGHPVEAFVMIDIVEESASTLLEALEPRKGPVARILPRQLFENEIIKVLDLPHGIGSVDVKCLLTYLSRDKKWLVYDNEVVKIIKDGTGNRHITETDREIASVKSVIASLTEQVMELSRSVEQHFVAAQEAVLKGNKQIALRHLRSRRFQNDLLAKRSAMLVQTEESCNKIEEAADQVEFMKAMRHTASVLQTLNAQTGGAEKVSAIIDNLQEEMSRIDEVDSALADHASGFVVDEDDIDRELTAMESQYRHIKDNASEKTSKQENEKQHIKKQVSGALVASSETPNSEMFEASTRALDEMQGESGEGYRHTEGKGYMTGEVLLSS